MTMAKVILFGRLQDIAGWRERALKPVPPTLLALRDLLSREDFRLGEALVGKGVQAAVNKAVTCDDVILNPGDEIAFLPPMSGG